MVGETELDLIGGGGHKCLVRWKNVIVQSLDRTERTPVGAPKTGVSSSPTVPQIKCLRNLRRLREGMYVLRSDPDTFPRQLNSRTTNKKSNISVV